MDLRLSKRSPADNLLELYLPESPLLEKTEDTLYESPALEKRDNMLRLSKRDLLRLSKRDLLRLSLPRPSSRRRSSWVLLLCSISL